VYDVTTTATINGGSITSGLVSGDDLLLDTSRATATFDSADARRDR
jgi:hypothetical protein